MTVGGLFTERDLATLARAGIDPAEAGRQVDLLTHPPAPAPLVRPCTRGDGIERISEERHRDLLSLFEELPFRTLLFEAISAMGTVGLSLGITPSLSPPGKIVIILLMFWGRVGILTFIFGMVSRDRTISKISYTETNIPVG